MIQERLHPSFSETVEKIHRPIALAIHRRWQKNEKPMLVGLCGPQGSGKSTSVQVLQALIASLGLSTVSLSIDDIYLTRDERQRLGQTVHPLLAVRGPPGSHDLTLGTQVIDAVLEGQEVDLPRFDKSRDDRAPPGDTNRTPSNTDILLLEGWCVGARPQSDEALEVPVNALERLEDPQGIWRRYVNEALASYQPLFDRISLLIQLKTPNFETIVQWRCEQEDKLRQNSKFTGENIMTDDQVERFVAHYERLTRHMMTEMPERADIVVDLDEQRQLTNLRIR